MGEHLFQNYYQVYGVVLFGIGFTALFLHRNLFKKVIGLNIMDGAVYLFLASSGYIQGGNAPIITQEEQLYINPIPTGLVLTGIVVSVSMTAVSLALIRRLYREYHTLDLDEILVKATQEV